MSALEEIGKEVLTVLTIKRFVVTLCGSTKFKKEYEEVYKRLTLAGHTVLTTSLFAHADGLEFTDEEIEILTKTHYNKIDISDGFYVINLDGYVGESTKKEIEYAIKQGKEVYYLEKR